MIRHARGFDIYGDEYKKYSAEDSELWDFCRNHSPLYIYGAGKFGTAFATAFEMNEISYNGFVVSKSDGIEYRGHSVIEVGQLNKVCGKNAGVLIAL